MQRKKVLIVIGTRPEAIKMCPVVQAMKRYDTIETRVVSTGQHRELLNEVLEIFSVVPDYHLDVMLENQTLIDITKNILMRLEAVLKDYKPDLVLVHGDTSTTFVGALGAFYQHIPVGHVEAGLRTNNIYSPFPEEFNRQAVSLIAKFNFAPTAFARENLLKCNVPSERIYITGNTAIDAIRTTVKSDFHFAFSDWIQDSRLILVTAHRRENLGERMHKMFRAIRRIVDDYPDTKVIYPVHPNPIVRAIAHEELDNHPNVRLIEPMDVVSFHNAMNLSYLVMTDSGGLQEEAPFLHKPVLVLRDTTERQEALKAGTIRLVGVEEDAIYAACQRLLDDPEEYRGMAEAINPYGDGTASIQIAHIIDEYFRSQEEA